MLSASGPRSGRRIPKTGRVAWLCLPDCLKMLHKRLSGSRGAYVLTASMIRLPNEVLKDHQTEIYLIYRSQGVSKTRLSSRFSGITCRAETPVKQQACTIHRVSSPMKPSSLCNMEPSDIPRPITGDSREHSIQDWAATNSERRVWFLI